MNIRSRKQLNKAWTVNRAAEGLYLPITIEGGNRIWSWAGAPTKQVDIICTVPSLLTWQEIVDGGYMPTYRQSISDDNYTTHVTLASAVDSDDADFDIFGAYYLDWIWTLDASGHYPSFMEKKEGSSVYTLVSNWRDYGEYQVDSIFPQWIYVTVSTKTNTIIQTETDDEGKTKEVEVKVPVFPELTFSVLRKEAGADDSTYSVASSVVLNATEVTCGLRNHLAGDPRLFKPNKNGKLDGDSGDTKYEYKYRMSCTDSAASYFSEWTGRTEKWIDDNKNNEHYIESEDLQQVLPDVYVLAKTFSDWPVNLTYDTKKRIKTMNTEDNPNTYKVISLGTTLVTVNSDCNYYGFIPPKTGLYKFTADSTNAFIGYASTMIDEEGIEMFGEATWADDGLSFTLMCSKNKIVFVACSTADFSYESYNLTVECLSE